MSSRRRRRAADRRPSGGPSFSTTPPKRTFTRIAARCSSPLDATDGGEAVHRARGRLEHEAAAVRGICQQQAGARCVPSRADHELARRPSPSTRFSPRAALKLRGERRRTVGPTRCTRRCWPAAPRRRRPPCRRRRPTAWQEEQPAARTTLKAQQPALADRRDFRGWWHGQHGARKAGAPRPAARHERRGRRGGGGAASSARLEQEATHNRATAAARAPAALGSGNDRHGRRRSVSPWRSSVVSYPSWTSSRPRGSAIAVLLDADSGRAPPPTRPQSRRRPWEERGGRPRPPSPPRARAAWA